MLQNGTVVLLNYNMRKLSGDEGSFIIWFLFQIFKAYDGSYAMLLENETLIGHIEIKTPLNLQYSSTVPKSCIYLQIAGHTKSGLHQVKLAEDISTVFRDMSMQWAESGGSF